MAYREWDPGGGLADRPDNPYVAVRFLQGGAGRMFGVPADALTDAPIPLRELWGQGFDWGPPATVNDVDRLRALVATRVRDGNGAASDQAHLATEVKRLAGISITQLR